MQYFVVECSLSVGLFEQNNVTAAFEIFWLQKMSLAPPVAQYNHSCPIIGSIVTTTPTISNPVIIV